jgi:Lrp/AsnC family transcriptional regulator for asnA, asnC and gidA
MIADIDVVLDKLDFEILSHLESDGRKSYSAIARATGVSTATVYNRVSKMVGNKTLTIVGRVNPFRAGLGVFALVFIAIRPPQLIDEAVETVLKYPEVSFCGVVTGKFDIHIDVMCRDNDHLYELLHDRICNIPGVVDTETTPILRVYQWMQPSLQLLKDHHLGESPKRDGDGE